MTENEAIEIIRDKIETCEFYFAENDRYPRWCEYEFLESLGAAISSLKEIQQYREIGTVEECKELASMFTQEKKNALGKIVDEWNEYIEIGTVEECREGVEKQKPKKPKDSLKIKPVIDENGAYVDADVTVYLLCPNCGEMVGIDENVDKFCRECGQAIDENLEGMEDEEN